MLSPSTTKRNARNARRANGNVGVITNAAAIAALRVRVAELGPLVEQANAFASACYHSAFGEVEAVIQWGGIQYVADRSDYYDAAETARELSSQLYRAQMALAEAEAYEAGKNPPPVTIGQMARIIRA
jgi:hypothetical protein